MFAWSPFATSQSLADMSVTRLLLEDILQEQVSVIPGYVES